MRTLSPAKTSLTLIQDRRRPDPAAPRRGTIETALELEFRGVENLLRSIDDLAAYWAIRRTRW